jgi:predicted RNA-binding Zn-ribbon protein involved in translation (DUF1610 family)
VLGNEIIIFANTASKLAGYTRHIVIWNQFILTEAIMPVTVSCTGCGKQLNVKDEFLGRRLKCPQCGATFTAAEMPRATAAPAGGKSKDQTPALHISKGIIIMIAVVIIVPGILAFWHFGPGHVQDEWQKHASENEDNVRSVIDRGLRDYLISNGELDFKSVHAVPRTLDITFILSPMYVTMPETVGFVGTTTQGAITGKYHPKTEEVEADVEVGGLSLPGTGAIRRGNKEFHVTGREKNSVLTIEIDGKPVP